MTKTLKNLSSLSTSYKLLKSYECFNKVASATNKKEPPSGYILQSMATPVGSPIAIVSITGSIDIESARNSCSTKDFCIIQVTRWRTQGESLIEQHFGG